MSAANVGIFNLYFGYVFVKKPSNDFLITVANRVGSNLYFLMVFASLFLIFNMFLQKFCLQQKNDIINKGISKILM